MMKRKLEYLAFLVLVFLIYSCRNANDQQNNLAKEEPVSENLDSVFIKQFLDNHLVYESYRNKIEKFYKARKYRLAWSNQGEFIPQALMFVNLIENFGNYGIVWKDSSTGNITDTILFLENIPKPWRKDAVILQKKLDLILTSEYYRFTPKLLQGTIDPTSNDSILWNVEPQKIKYTDLLDSILSTNNSRNSFLLNFEIHPQLSKLKGVLAAYREIEQIGGWSEYSGKFQDISPQDTGYGVRFIAQRLLKTGDIRNFDTIRAVYNESLEQGVRNFQKRHGLKASGVVDSLTLACLNIPVKDKLKQILVNMERWRWVPMPMPQKYILVNIPDFKLTIYQNGKPFESMKIIVGKEGSKTVIFKGNIEYIVVNPYWNIPRSIAVDEILPKIKVDTGYLRKHNIEVGKDWNFNILNKDTITWKNLNEDNFDYTLRQKPGDQNPLGRIKFMFPNQFSIYLHDTPNYQLFDEHERVFSHGCIRIQRPNDLAYYLLGEDNGKILKVKESLALNKTQNIALVKPVPVYILYFTVWVDENGIVQFRNDYYGHDRKLAQQLFEDF